MISMQPFTQKLFFVYFLSIAFVFSPFIVFGSVSSSSTEHTENTVSASGFAGIIESLHLDTLFQSIKGNSETLINNGTNTEYNASKDMPSLPIGGDALNKIKTPDFGLINKNVEEETGVNVPRFFQFLGKVFKFILSSVTTVFNRLTKPTT